MIFLHRPSPARRSRLLPVSATLLRPRNQERIARRYSTPTFARSALPSFVEKGDRRRGDGG